MGKLGFYLHPESIAVIGASSIPGKVGYAVIRNIVNSKYAGKLYPINPRPGTIFDYQTYPSVLNVPDPIDVAIICIPAKFVNKVVEECGQKGVKGIIIVAAGFREIGGDGVQLEEELVRICKKYNIRCIGPNVLGNITTSANMSFSMKTPMRGRVAMISQSGAMMTAVLDWADTKRIGFSHFISLGNKCDVDEIDFIDEISNDPETSLMILYIESVNDGNRFMKIVEQATKKKPVIILKSGISDAGKAAASSHTGALSGNDMVFDLAFERAGVIRARTMQELFDYATIFNQSLYPLGNKFAILTNAGGPGIIATDCFEENHIEFAHFTEATTDKLRKLLPPQASIHNPVDIVGDATPKRFRDALTVIFEEDSNVCAGSLVLVTPQSTTDPIAVANQLVDVHRQFPDRFLVTTFMGGDTMSIPHKILQENSIPCYSFPEPAVKSLREVLHYQSLLRNIQNDNNIDENVNNSKRILTVENQDKVKTIIKNAINENRNMLSPMECNEVLSIYGINSCKSKLVHSAGEAIDFAKEIGFPVIMKIASSDIVHKSDCGGVILNIKTPEDVSISYEKILNDVALKGPKNAKIDGIEVQMQIDVRQHMKTNEIIFGMNRDPQWGPVVMVGAGGIYANYIKDVAFELARGYKRDVAKRQIEKTKIYKILEGVRGEPKSDVKALLEMMMRTVQMIMENEEITEMDMNPVLVFEEGSGVCAIDTKIMINK